MKTNAARLLDQQQIPYTLREYAFSPDELDARTAAAKMGLPPEHVYKTLVVRGDRTGVMLACIAASAGLDLKALAACSGNKRAELVPLREVQPLTGYVRGGVSPLGSKKPFPLFLDAAAAGLAQVSISAGRRGLQMLLSGADLARATGAMVAPIARGGP